MTTNTTKNETISAISAFFKDFQTAHEKEPPKGPKWDQKKPNQISAKHFLLSSASSIPPREWLYGNHLIRGYLSLTVAPGGLGKSSMLLVEAISMVTKRSLFGFAPVHRLRVWYWCGEDPLVEIERRIAAICLHYSIPPEDIGDRLMIDSGREMPIKLAESNRNGIAIIQKTLDQLVATIKKEKIDVLIIDPLITIHEIQENDTTGMNTLVNQLRNVADATGCAIELVHHTSKAGAMASDDFGIYASRGAGALIDGVRSARYLSRMPEKISAKFGLSAKEAKSYFSVNMGKANLAPMDGATWRRMIGVPLNNGKSFWETGDVIGVCVPWTQPDVLEDVTAEQIEAVMAAIRAVDVPPTKNERGQRWVGYVVADVMGLDIGLTGTSRADRTNDQNAARAKVGGMLSQWFIRKLLITEDVSDGRTGRTITIVRAAEPQSK